MREMVKWGVLGAAKIALVKVIPGMQRGDWSDVSPSVPGMPRKPKKLPTASAFNGHTAPTRTC